MKALYAKTLLFLHAGLDEILTEIDEVVLDKALSSVHDTSPVMEQYNSILNLTKGKAKLIELGKIIDAILKELTRYERVVLDYNFFKKLDKIEYAKHDLSSRNYYRRKKTIIEKFSRHLEERGITDEKFKKEYLSIKLVNRFFRLTCVYENGVSYDSNNLEKENSRVDTVEIKDKCAKNDYSKSFSS